MTTPQKFMFKNSFEASSLREKELAALKCIYTEEDLLEARQTGYAQGFMDGVTQAVEQSKEEIQNTLEEIKNKLGEVLGRQENIGYELVNNVIKVGQTIAEKVTVVEAEKQAVARCKYFIQQTMAKFLQKPEMIIHIHPDIYPQLQQMMHLENVSFQEDTHLRRYDCVISWHDGGVEMLMNNLVMDINHLITTWCEHHQDALNHYKHQDQGE